MCRPANDGARRWIWRDSPTVTPHNPATASFS